MTGSSQAATGQIYISHRFADTHTAVSLAIRLGDQFGLERILVGHLSMDERGSALLAAIREAVAKCSILLALVGRNWAAIGDVGPEKGLINAPKDPIRVEIETALELSIPVIPVLVDDAVLPQADDLPPSLLPLTELRALTLRLDPLDNQRIVPSYAEQLVATLQAALAGSSGSMAAGPSAPPKRFRWVHGRKLRRPMIFLCYRHEDTQGFAGRIYDRLVSKYGYEQVFRDIDSIPTGVRFPAWIESRMGQCSVVIVLIGAAWLAAKDDNGQRRLDSPKDWVRQEIETALRHDIPIIPVRVEGAPMPSEEELPQSIANLAEFENTEVADRRWDYDIGQLIQAIDDLSASA